MLNWLETQGFVPSHIADTWKEIVTQQSQSNHLVLYCDNLRTWALSCGRGNFPDDGSFTDLPQRILRWLKIAIHNENWYSEEIMSMIHQKTFPLSYGLRIEENNSIYFELYKRRRYRLVIYYAKAMGEFANNLVKTGHLTRWEIELLIHEMILLIRTYLESNLPPEHPLLCALGERYQIPKVDEKTIL